MVEVLKLFFAALIFLFIYLSWTIPLIVSTILFLVFAFIDELDRIRSEQRNVN